MDNFSGCRDNPILELNHKIFRTGGGEQDPSVSTGDLFQALLRMLKNTDYNEHYFNSE